MLHFLITYYFDVLAIIEFTQMTNLILSNIFFFIKIWKKSKENRYNKLFYCINVTDLDVLQHQYDGYNLCYTS